VQQPLEILIHRAPELGTVQPLGNARTIGVELPADNFSRHMSAAAFELPPEFTGEFRHPLTGTDLPAAGNTLPAMPEEQPLAPILADHPSNAEPVAQSLVAEARPNISNIAEADPIPQILAEDIANAGILTAKLEPAVSPVPTIPRSQNIRLTDSPSLDRRDATRPVISKLQGDPVDTANHVIKDRTKLKMPTETHAAKSPLSGAPPLAQLTSVTLAPSGAGQASPVPAATLVTAVDTPFFDPAWADALQDRILWLAGKNIRAAEIRLNPAELGALKVQISVDDKSVNISFSATHAVTRDALEIALPRLKDMLAENGMSLANASVSDQEIANQRNHSDQRNPADTALSDEESTQVVSDLLPNHVAIKDPLSLVDTYV